MSGACLIWPSWQVVQGVSYAEAGRRTKPKQPKPYEVIEGRY